MTAYVLFVFVFWGNASGMETWEFPSKEACVTAGEAFRKDAGLLDPQAAYICVNAETGDPA